MTCMGYPGTTLDKVELDAETFAEWKIDMLKLDGCFSTAKERAQGEFMPGSTIIWREGSSCGSQSACTRRQQFSQIPYSCLPLPGPLKMQWHCSSIASF